MNIPVKTTVKKFFKIYVECLNPVLDLKIREKEVLSTILAAHYPLRNHPDDFTYEKLFSSRARKMMREYISMSEASFNNHISQLKKKKVLSDTNRISKFIISNYPEGDTLDINYRIIINR